jgi:predicted ester cyclase
MRTTLVLALAVSAGIACNKKKSEEQVDKGNTGTTPTTGSDTTAPKPTEPPPPAKPATKSGAELADWYLECGKKMADKKMDDFKKDCTTAETVIHHVDDKDMKIDDMSAMMANMQTAFPDGKMEPQLVMVNGRNIFAVVLFTGTHEGALKTPDGKEIPATHKKVGQMFFQKLAINDENKATEVWEFMDPASMMGQLGLLPKGTPFRAAIDKGWDGAPIKVVAADDAKEKANLEAAKKSNDAFNAHKIPDIQAFWADDAVESDQADDKDAKGKKELDAGLKMFFTAFPDVKLEVPNTYAAGDYVVEIGTFSGTNSGPMGKMKKTDKKVTGNYAELLKIKDGKVTNLWRFRNGLAMAMQLGLAPQPGAAPAPGDKKDEKAGAPAKKDDAKKSATEPAKAPEPTK